MTTFNLRALLEEMIEKNASDLHCTAGERPKLRIDGDIVERQRGGGPVAQGHALPGLLRPHREPEEALRAGGRARLLVRHPEPGAVPRQRVQAAGLRGHGAPDDSVQRAHLRGPRPARGGLAAGRPAPRPGAGDRPDRLGQVHHAGGGGRPDQQGPQGPHHHGRGPDRVHPLPPELHRQPARGGDRHQELLHRAQVRPARGPRRHPRRRNARPGNHRLGAHHRGNGPPGAGDAAHQLRGRIDQPDHRRLPVQPAEPGAGPAGLRAGRAS